MARRSGSTREAAAALRDAAGNLNRRLRQSRGDDAADALSWRERSALGLLMRDGPNTSAELARLERIRPQSMVLTLKALAERGLIEREADPSDGRRVVVTATAAGRRLYRARLDARLEQFAGALDEEFTAAEIEQLAAAAPLLDRLADRISERADSPRRTT